MDLSDFNFPFDATLVAKHPVRPRDRARLLALHRARGEIRDRSVSHLPEILQPGDLLVVNDTKVIPARFWGKKIPGGGNLEILLVRLRDHDYAEVLIKGRIRAGQKVACEGTGTLEIVEKQSDHVVIRWLGPGTLQEWVSHHGEIPLPPYLKRTPNLQDSTDYQTVFAEREGAIAAPTAGLHFTPNLLGQLKGNGIDMIALTLHVGPGTFLPVKTQNIQDHVMHPEWCEISQETVETIMATRRRGGRIVAVGTTVARSLESAVNDEGELTAYASETRLFIIPGFQFRCVDVLMTNFHFPETTLLMLVSAFAGREFVCQAYEHAVKERYRLYSYGDAMLIE